MVKAAGRMVKGEGRQRMDTAKKAEKLERARVYLAGNAQLREALGIAMCAELACAPLGAGEHNDNYVFSVVDDAASDATPSPGGASVVDGAASCSAASLGTVLAGTASSDASLDGAPTAPAASATRYVLRVNVAPQPFHADQVAYEEVALRALAESGRVPRVLYRDSSPEALGAGVLVISYCAGQTLDFDALRPGDLRCAAKIMADIHAVPVDAACPLHRPADPLRELFDECMARYEVYRASGHADARISRHAEELIARARALMDTAPVPDTSPSIVNTETLAAHFLIPKASAKAAAAADTCAPFTGDPGSFVDWERPLVGDLAQDLAYFTAPTTTFWDSERFLSAQEEADFIEAYWREVAGRIPRGNFDARYPAWRALTALRSTTWCCKAWAQCAGRPDIHPSAKAREKLSAYLSDAFFERLLA